METKFFVTVWLKKGDTEQDIDRFYQTIRQTASGLNIELDEECKVSPTGSRLTFYGTPFSESTAESELARLISAINEVIGRRAKGRILK
jgi:hypothetical protein